MKTHLANTLRQFLKASLLSTMVIGVVALAAAPAAAGDDDKGEKPAKSKDAPKKAPRMQPAGSSSKTQKMQQKLSELGQTLQQIQKKTMANNPELKKKRNNLRDMVDKKMNEQLDGTTVAELQKKLKALRSKIGGQKGNKKKRKATIGKYRNISRKLMSARQKVQSDKEVKKSRKSFQEDLKKAMNKQNPKTSELIKEYRKTQKKMQQERMKSMKRRMKQRGKKKEEGKAKDAPAKKKK